MSGIDFAALRREREARRGAPPPVAPDAPAANTAQPSLGPQDMPARMRAALDRHEMAERFGHGRRLGEETTEPKEEQGGGKRLKGAQTQPTIFVGGACKNHAGHHSVRPPQVPADAFEVDCRKSGTEVKVQGNIARLSAGLGSLHDRKPKDAKEEALVMDFLQRDAREIDRALSEGRNVWVHCAQGFNRGPSGLLAFLLLYTDATFDQACDAVRRARPRARTRHNTFVEQLTKLSLQSKIKHALHSRVAIVDGGNDPDDDRRG